MNRGLKYYSIMLVMITTLVFTLHDFGVVNATISTNQNNSTQINPLNELYSDSSDKSTCDDCASNNDDNNNNNNNDDDSDGNNNNNDNNNDDDSSSSSSNNDDVPMSLPFNSNLADESDDEKDYSNAIPFP